MIKRNGDNVFVIASSNNQCQGKSAVSLCPAAATRIPRATAARMTQPDAQQNTKEANIALSTYVEKWKNRYEEAERKHKAYLLKSEKGVYYSIQQQFTSCSKIFTSSHFFCGQLYLRMPVQFWVVSYANEIANENPQSRICQIMRITCCLWPLYIHETCLILYQASGDKSFNFMQEGTFYPLKKNLK